MMGEDDDELLERPSWYISMVLELDVVLTLC